jgi:hypothetical protein
MGARERPVIVVADTTPLLYLSRIGQLEQLRSLYQQIACPAAPHSRDRGTLRRAFQWGGDHPQRAVGA